MGRNLPPKLVVEDQRDRRGATENKGPNLQIPDDAKRKPQNEAGNNQPKRTRMDDQHDDHTDPAGAKIKVKTKSKIPESLRREQSASIMSKSQLQEGAEPVKRGQFFSTEYNFSGGDSSCKPELVLAEVDGALGELGTFGEGNLEGQVGAQSGIKTECGKVGVK